MVEEDELGQDPPSSEPESDKEDEAGTGRALLLLALLTVGVTVLLYRVYPVHHPLGEDANFIDVIFANNLVLFAARLVLLSTAGVLAVASVFIVISFWQRGKAGHWMSRFGPFETQAVENLQEQVDQWTRWWQEEFERRQELEGGCLVARRT